MCISKDLARLQQTHLVEPHEEKVFVGDDQFWSENPVIRLQYDQLFCRNSLLVLDLRASEELWIEHGLVDVKQLSDDGFSECGPPCIRQQIGLIHQQRR